LPEDTEAHVERPRDAGFLDGCGETKDAYDLYYVIPRRVRATRPARTCSSSNRVE
jgi:hypothetical protein